MSRRCKPGQRARIIAGEKNSGCIVLVVRPYFCPEKIGTGHWPEGIYPWVVASLGAPLEWHRVDDPDIRGTAMTVVICDTVLEPLDDDDDGLTRSTEKDKPISKPKPAKRPIKQVVPAEPL